INNMRQIRSGTYSRLTNRSIQIFIVPDPVCSSGFIVDRLWFDTSHDGSKIPRRRNFYLLFLNRIRSVEKNALRDKKHPVIPERHFVFVMHFNFISWLYSLQFKTISELFFY